MTYRQKPQQNKTEDRSIAMEKYMRLKQVFVGDMTYEETVLFMEMKELPKCKELWCNNIKYIRRLPELPKCKRLYCGNNELQKLPNLPNCKELVCSRNRLRNLPDLPNCKYLTCSRNQLQSLPDLPKCKYVWCTDNQLTVLPNMPKCLNLRCSKNQLTEFPELPCCEHIEKSDDEHLYYSKSIATKFQLSYPSKGHHGHYVELWQNAYNKISKVKLLKQDPELDEYLAYEIIKKI